jgi:hypothetical protein
MNTTNDTKREQLMQQLSELTLRKENAEKRLAEARSGDYYKRMRTVDETKLEVIIDYTKTMIQLTKEELGI